MPFRRHYEPALPPEKEKVTPSGESPQCPKCSTLLNVLNRRIELSGQNHTPVRCRDIQDASKALDTAARLARHDRLVDGIELLLNVLRTLPEDVRQESSVVAAATDTAIPLLREVGREPVDFD